MRYRSGFSNAAADKIWNDHIGNNAFVQHRDQCAVCLEAFNTRRPDEQGAWCANGRRIFDAVLDEVIVQIDEIQTNQN